MMNIEDLIQENHRLHQLLHNSNKQLDEELQHQEDWHIYEMSKERGQYINTIQEAINILSPLYHLLQRNPVDLDRVAGGLDDAITWLRTYLDKLQEMEL